MDFASYYSYTPELWEPAPKESNLKLIWLTDKAYPVEDPQGVASLLTAQEQEHLTPHHKFCAEWFDLTNPMDLEKFVDVYQKITDLWYTILGEETFTIDGREKKFLRYLNSYYTIPPWLTQQLLGKS